MMCQCRFINCHKYTTLVGDVDSQGEAVQVWRQYIGKSLNHLLPFCYEPKTALKKVKPEKKNLSHDMRYEKFQSTLS